MTALQSNLRAAWLKLCAYHSDQHLMIYAWVVTKFMPTWPFSCTKILRCMREGYENSCPYGPPFGQNSCDACVRGIRIAGKMAHNAAQSLEKIFAIHAWRGYQNPCPYSMQGDPSYGLKAWHLCEKGSIKLWAYMAHYVFPTLAIYIWWVFKSVSI